MKKWKLWSTGQLLSLSNRKVEKTFIFLSNMLTPPMLSQHSRSQTLIKEEGCDRRGESTINLAILIEMKPERKLLGRNPLSDVPYRNPGIVLNGQGLGRHPVTRCVVIWARCQVSKDRAVASPTCLALKGFVVVVVYSDLSINQIWW